MVEVSEMGDFAQNGPASRRRKQRNWEDNPAELDFEPRRRRRRRRKAQRDPWEDEGQEDDDWMLDLEDDRRGENDLGEFGRH